jgi:hypothetical protein
VTDKQTIINAIRTLAADNDGVAPGRGVFEKETGIRQAQWRGRYWEEWSNAVAEAGFAPNKPLEKVARETVLQGLIRAIRHFGRLPTQSQLRLLRRTDTTVPATSTISKNFRTKDDWTLALRAYCEGKQELEDVLRLCGESPLPADASAGDAASNVKVGYVYLALMKMGRERRYKIGKAVLVERRANQIALHLPEELEMIHTINTDDAYGIEYYWHRRFADKCTNREWFKLSIADVQAFKKRRFQ